MRYLGLLLLLLLLTVGCGPHNKAQIKHFWQNQPPVTKAVCPPELTNCYSGPEIICMKDIDPTWQMGSPTADGIQTPVTEPACPPEQKINTGEVHP